MTIPSGAKLCLQISTLLYFISAAGYLCYLFNQKDRIQKTAFYLIGAGVIFHIISIMVQVVQSKSLPVHNLEQSLSIAGLALGCMFLYFQLRMNLKILGVFAACLISIIMGSLLLIPDTAVEQISILKGFWLYAHILLVFLGEAALALACGAGILYLLQERDLKTKHFGFFFKRLPSLDLLDSVSYTCITTGFSLLTVGLITGFIYAKSVWGHFWSWDPKEIWSVGTWLVYAALLHYRLFAGWRGRKSAIITIIGFLILAFTFLGVNLILGGHHQGFTK
ncbi:MAG: c-type cytochrome biogenesis protein CcsB [Desulfobacteraceae bacterium]|nr:c-type cytochrome biogenesis protein CcsB [Desulfobacteraceae bacterium]